MSEAFERWLRSVCFQKPTPEAYDLAKCAWDHMDAKLKAAEAERDAAVFMLAEWCVCVELNGSGWDDWDECYKDAAYRPGPLRELLDAEIAKRKASPEWDR